MTDRNLLARACDPEVRTATFGLIGSSAIEAFEAQRTIFDEAKPPRKGV